MSLNKGFFWIWIFEFLEFFVKYCFSLLLVVSFEFRGFVLYMVY